VNVKPLYSEVFEFDGDHDICIEIVNIFPVIITIAI
jgi:hypothetical protein